MMDYRFDRVVIKVGSNVLTRGDGRLDIARMAEIVSQIAALREHGVEVILVSSGAVASGRGVLPVSEHLDEVSERQLYSAVGQARLINRYYDFFSSYGIVCGQVLTTKESLMLEDHYLNQRNCMSVMLEHGVIPVINENDTVSVTELMFTDNDELSGLVASMMQARCLVLLSNVDGVYDGSPDSPGSRLLREVVPGEDLSGYIGETKSSFGRGGMLAKCRIAIQTASKGIETVIANGRRENIILSVLSDSYADVPCTRFLPAESGYSSLQSGTC